MRYCEPFSRSIRREMSSWSWSLNWVGASCFSLSIWIATSAVLRGGRLLLPAKITSSISAARIDLCDVSPITQRSASTRFDLPQPFGPTTPVRPGSMRKSVGSTKDLNPIRRRRVSFISILFQLPPSYRALARFAPPPRRPQACTASSAQHQRPCGRRRGTALARRMCRRPRYSKRKARLIPVSVAREAEKTCENQWNTAK